MYGELTRCNNIVVYTCQKGQLTRCDFFLWDDEAKPREVAAVLNNSRSEPPPAPQTPSRRPAFGNRPVTPTDRSGTESPDVITPLTPSETPSTNMQTRKALDKALEKEEDTFGWPTSDDDELSKVADRVSMAPPETPRKAAKTDIFTTPGKKRHGEMDNGATTTAALPTPGSDDVFTSSATGTRGKDIFSAASAAWLLSPDETPTPLRYRDGFVGTSPGGESELVKDVGDALREISLHLGQNVMEALRPVLDRYALRTQGIAKGRDISRVAVKAKEEKIVELQGRIAVLEAERETNRAVIRHLRRDLEAGRRK